ncbi:ATP-binding protein [Microvirga sesbaniae]|uniref:ATP-binding protein n=1 Tax=Microvirga sesbaniae TaxID=681392 RepID=UPI0021C81700|nr:ATP-binding protein [Microvirga sp. HBU67692]
MNNSYELVPPPAHAMIESLRGVGYSVEAALADIIDNSLAADAKNVRLHFEFAGADSWISILDDGRGMNEPELRRAMTLGGRSPLDTRTSSDLGRFGFGLKTASFAQCRRLTVASKKGGSRAVRRWDLDLIARPDVNDWRLLSEPAPGSEDRLLGLENEDSGTLVLWERMDRLTAGMLSDDRRSEDAFLLMIDRVEQHLGMVFHRFLEGSHPELKIFINGTDARSRVRPWDPFLAWSPATSITPVERIPTANGLVELQGYVLPHKDQLTEEEFREGAGRDGWTSQQGFYVYRNRRLLVAGGWLGLGEPRLWTREEPYKLARLSLEFPNTADEDWEIDIKKSTARPPRVLKARLTALAETVRSQARQVFAHRGAYGKRAPTADLQSAWTVDEAGSGTRYRINRSHPAILLVLEAAGRDQAVVEQALRLIEETVPVQRIWLDTVEKGEIRKEAFAEAPPPELEGIACSLFKHLTTRVGLSPELARQQLLSTDPFQNYPDIINRLVPEAA